MTSGNGAPIRHWPRALALRLSRVAAVARPEHFAAKLRNPVFMVGCGRSGTTMLAANIRAGGVAVYPSEANRLWHPTLYPWHRARIDAPPFWIDPYAFTRASLASRTERDDRILKAAFGAYQYVTGGSPIVNKTVMVTFMLPHVLELFPDARFVHLVRDGRAVAYSYTVKEQPKIESHPAYANAGYRPTFDELLNRFAEHWKRHILEMEKQKERLRLVERGVILELKYEQVCAAPREAMERIVRFAGWDPDRFLYREYRHIGTRNHKYSEALDESVVRRLTRIMEPALRAHGYVEA